MRVVLTTMGSVEDLPPFVGLAGALRDQGVECHFALPSNMTEWVRGAGFEVTQLGPDHLGRLYEEAEPALQEGRSDEAIDRYGQAVMESGPEAFQTLAGLTAEAQCLVAANSMPLGLIVHELTGVPYVAVQSHNPTEQIGTPDELVTFRQQLGLSTSTAPTPVGISPVYGLSPLLNLVATSPTVLRVMLPSPLDWPDTCQAPGYFFHIDRPDFAPDDRLLDVTAGEAPIVFAFGKRRSAERERITAEYLAVAQAVGRRAVLRDPWTPGVTRTVSENALFVGDEVPDWWLYERASCVVHDADGPVAASTLRAGVPSVPIPSDPSLLGWARACESLGCSPAVVPYENSSVENLTGPVRAAVTEPGYSERAREVRARILAEPGAEGAAKLIRDTVTASTGPA